MEQFLIAGHDCPLLVFLLLEAVVSQGGLDGILSQHLVGEKIVSYQSGVKFT